MEAIMRVTLVLCGLLGLMASAAAQSVPPALVSKCQGCHAGAQSTKAGAPRLNGQNAAYLAARIRSFRDPTVQSPHASFFMMDVNSSLSDAQVQAMARYFADQPATDAAPAGAAAAKGDRLYHQGGDGVAACGGCHGAKGEGSATAPRIAGQRSVYLRAQLEDFNMLTRVHAGMNRQSRMMSADQIGSLVAYLAKD
jgi:cytochrome c553